MTAIVSGAESGDELGCQNLRGSGGRADRITNNGVVLHTADGTVHARRVIIATGYATAAFKPLLNHFTMMQTYVPATQPVPTALRAEIGLGDVMLWDTGHPYYYARWTNDHRLLMGGADRRSIREGPRRRNRSCGLLSGQARPGGTITESWRDGLPTMSREPVTLRELRAIDAPSLVESMTNPAVGRFIAPAPPTVDGFKRFIRWARKERRLGRHICFGIVPTGHTRAVGVLQIWPIEADFSTAEWGFAVAELGAAEHAVHAFVLIVSTFGMFALASSSAMLATTTLDLWAVLLALCTLLASRFPIKMPGRPATVSVSEVFVFTSILMFGPAPATLTVAMDGLWISCWQKDRRLYRTLFNVAEPSVSTYAAASVFFALTRPTATAPNDLPRALLLLSVAAMTATYFVLNSVLQAAAVALENRGSIVETWSQHALYLAINYYAAASLATLAVDSKAGLNLEVVGLVAPVLLLSYAAYKTAASRIEDANEHVAGLEQLYRATVETLAIAVDAKDQVTHGHIRRVQRHTITLARMLGVTAPIELKALEAASLLHDVGKLAVPDYVLNKPGALSVAEFARMKPHAAKGAEILTAVHFPYPVVPIVRHHHESWNGSGYPDGLAGEAIPLGARIVTVVDCFDALTSDRPYRRKMKDEDALRILLDRRGTMYDPRVVDAFIELVPALREEDRRSDPLYGQVDAGSDSLPPALGSSQPTRELPQERKSWALDEVALDARIALAWPSGEACLFARHSTSSDDLLVVAYATPALLNVIAGQRVPVGEGLVGWVAAHRHTIVNSEAALDLGEAAHRLELGVCAATPVFALGDLVGVLAVYLRPPKRFSDEDVRTVGWIAQEIGFQPAGANELTMKGPVDRPRTASLC